MQAFNSIPCQIPVNIVNTIFGWYPLVISKATAPTPSSRRFTEWWMVLFFGQASGCARAQSSSPAPHPASWAWWSASPRCNQRSRRFMKSVDFPKVRWGYPPWIHEICGDSTCAHLAANIVPEIVLLVWDLVSFLHSRHNFNHRVLFRSANVVCTACRFKQLLTIYRRHGNLSKSISVISISQWTPIWPVTPLCSTMSKAAATSSHCWNPITCSVLVSLAPNSDYCNPEFAIQNTRLLSQHATAIH